MLPTSRRTLPVLRCCWRYITPERSRGNHPKAQEPPRCWGYPDRERWGPNSEVHTHSWRIVWTCCIVVAVGIEGAKYRAYPGRKQRLELLANPIKEEWNSCGARQRLFAHCDSKPTRGEVDVWPQHHEHGSVSLVVLWHSTFPCKCCLCASTDPPFAFRQNTKNHRKNEIQKNVKIKKKANHASSTTPIGGKTETVVMKRMQFTLAL